MVDGCMVDDCSNRLVFEISSNLFDTPYCDTFNIETIVDVKSIGPNKSSVDVRCGIHFIKKPMILIRSACDCRPADGDDD